MANPHSIHESKYAKNINFSSIPILPSCFQHLCPSPPCSDRPPGYLPAPDKPLLEYLEKQRCVSAITSTEKSFHWFNSHLCSFHIFSISSQLGRFVNSSIESIDPLGERPTCLTHSHAAAFMFSLFVGDSLLVSFSRRHWCSSPVGNTTTRSNGKVAGPIATENAFFWPENNQVFGNSKHWSKTCVILNAYMCLFPRWSWKAYRHVPVRHTWVWFRLTLRIDHSVQRALTVLTMLRFVNMTSRPSYQPCDCSAFGIQASGLWGLPSSEITFNRD